MDEFDKRQFERLRLTKDIKLKPPVELAALSNLEDVAKLSMPAQLVEILKVGDGQSRHDGPPLFCGEYLQSSKDIAGWINWHHEENQGEPSDCFDACPFVQQGKRWQTDWIPITYGPELVFLYVDCNPSPLGTFGQVILSSINTGRCGVVAKDLNELVAFSLHRDDLVTKWPFLKESG